MRVLISGGAGCLGSNIVEHLLAAKHQVMVIDNFATGHKESLPVSEQVQLVEGSVADAQLVEQVFADFLPTHVIHSAAAYKEPDNWNEDTQSNVVGSINMIKAAEKYDVKRFVNFQTALCYGRPEKCPVPVTAGVAPFTSYGISKTAGEQYLMLSDIPVVSLRLANICGPRLSIGPIPTFYKRLKAGQNCFCSSTIRDFLDMRDFLALLDIVLERTDVTGIYNVSTGQGHSIKDIFDQVAKHLKIEGADVPIVPPGDDDVAEMVLDSSYTEQVFGWKAKYSFEQTIKQQLEWYDEYGVNYIFSHLSAPEE